MRGSHLSPFLVEEVITLVDDALVTAAAQCLCLLSHTVVVVSLTCILRLGIDVYAEIFTSCRLACLRMPYRWVEVKVQRYLTVLDGSFPDRHFRADVCHILVVLFVA